MEIIEHSGIVRDVIDAINAGAADGLNVVKVIKLTREEMNEWERYSPFNSNVGKYYGDADIPPMMHVTNNASGQITGFFLSGVQVVCVE